jgi:hypothetical protein
MRRNLSQAMAVPRAPHFNEPRPRSVALFVGVGVALALATAMAGQVTRWSPPMPAAKPVAPSAPDSAAPPWTVAPAAPALFTLEPPPPGALRIETSLLSGSDARRDMFMSGDAAEAGPFSSLTVDDGRSGADASFFVTVARQAAANGLAVARLALPTTAVTRFGMMEIADLTLTTPHGPVACSAFRGTAETSPLRYSGWACGAGGAGTARAARCLVDSISLMPGHEDGALASLIRSTEELRDASCGPARIAPDQPIEPPMVRLDKKRPKRG